MIAETACRYGRAAADYPSAVHLASGMIALSGLELAGVAMLMVGVIGHDVPRSVRGQLRFTHPVASESTVAPVQAGASSPSS